jgi:hypothetical protein
MWLSSGIEVKATCGRTGFQTRDTEGAIDRKDSQFRPINFEEIFCQMKASITQIFKLLRNIAGFSVYN